jgi:hypothetical protein
MGERFRAGCCSQGYFTSDYPVELPLNFHVTSTTERTVRIGTGELSIAIHRHPEANPKSQEKFLPALAPSGRAIQQGVIRVKNKKVPGQAWSDWCMNLP